MGREAVAVHGANSIYLHPMEFRRGSLEPGKSPVESTCCLLLRWGKMAPFLAVYVAGFWHIQGVITLDPQKFLQHLECVRPFESCDKPIEKTIHAYERTTMVQDIVHEKFLFYSREGAFSTQIRWIGETGFSQVSLVVMVGNPRPFWDRQVSKLRVFFFELLGEARFWCMIREWYCIGFGLVFFWKVSNSVGQ